MRTKHRKADLVLRFFQGSKKYFLVAVLASGHDRIKFPDTTDFPVYRGLCAGRG